MESIQKNSGLYLTEGILLIILGVISIVMPITSTIAIGFIIGWVLLIGGIYRLFRSIKIKDELRHFWLSLLSGIVAAIIGFLFLTNILAGIYFLTIALALYFFIDGIALITASMTTYRNTDWGWILFSGIISLILSALMISGLPYAAIWIPGLLLGINLIMSGFSLTYLAASAQAPMQKYGT